MAKGYLYDNGDELITREDVNEVPDSSTAHAGDVLELDSNKKPKWTAPESELPSTGSASVGDVLTLDSDKEPVWSAPSGGGGILIVNYDENDPTSFTFDDTVFDAYPCNKTFKEINDLLVSGVLPVLYMNKSVGYLAKIDPDSDEFTGYPFYIEFGIPTGEVEFIATSQTSTLYAVFARQS